MTEHTLPDQISEVFRRQADHIPVPPADPRPIFTARSDPHRNRDGGWNRNRLALVLATVVAAVMVGGAAIRWSSQDTVTTGPTDQPGPALDFDTEVGVRLQAATFTVDTGGRTFSPSGVEVDVNGDPGWSPSSEQQGYTTLELTWHEHDVEMRVNFYVAGTTEDWWLSEIRTYDGADPGQWITMTGEYARTPAGQAFVGDLDIGPLHIGGLTLEAFGPRSSDCDGTGGSGQFVLEPTGPGLVEGSVVTTPGVTTGYSIRVAVLDALTCEPVEPETVAFRAATADAGVATVDVEDLAFHPEGPTGELGVSLTFTGPGATSLSVEAIDDQTGDILGVVVMPVTVDELS